MGNGALNLHKGVHDHYNSYQSAQLIVRLSRHSQRPMPGFISISLNAGISVSH
jgi:hypothetical protein